VTITSAKGKVTIAASQEILLTSGGGYIRLKGAISKSTAPAW
jgi:type VI secretion system secreted protein VgrG